MKGGVIYVAFGTAAAREAAESVYTLKEHNQLPVRVFLEGEYRGPETYTTDQKAHHAKVTAFKWSPYSRTLLLDADTRVHGDLSLGFELLRKGWEVVMVPSFPEGATRALWSLPPADRTATFEALGTMLHVMLNTGVLFFQKTRRVQALFAEWEREWLRFKDRDQGAFLRALAKCPVRLWLLGAPYNSARGEIVEHLFGRAR